MHTNASSHLRAVLTANAAFSATGGLIALLAGPWVSDELGIDHVALTRTIGAGLIAFAIGVLTIARSGDGRLLRESLLVSVGDLAWVIGTVAVVGTGVLTATGTIVAALIGLAVADFAALQLRFRARARRVESTPGPVLA